MQKTELELFIPPEKQGTYYTLPFTMPEDVDEFQLSYHYLSYREESHTVDGGRFTSRQQVNIIDLGLIGPDGRQVGVSGSNKESITLSANRATPGYTPRPLTPGRWEILIGAYKVAPEGVTVRYTLTFMPKTRRLFIGDPHTHTVASDGILTIEALAAHARNHGLDFLAITDHNQMSISTILNRIPGITLIPGVEWTHYQGHANFLGVDQPYDEPFYANNEEEVKDRFQSARERGATIVINHPADPGCGFHFDLNQLPFDCIEIWNGPMRESNLQAVGMWQAMLEAGRKIPAVGGSDYHKDNLFQIVGSPCMGVYAKSNQPADLLRAIRAGHSFIRFAPQGPSLEMTVGEAIMGDTVNWEEDQLIQIKAQGLQKDDVVRVIHNQDSTDLLQAPGNGDCNLTYPVSAPGFVRVEIYRTFLPGIPPLLVLISNPIYFEQG
jgi:hypothetical protein